MTVLVKDTFTRSDSSTTLGTTEIGAKTWVTTNGARWGISNGMAYPVSPQWDYPTYLNAGVSDQIAYSLKISVYNSTQQIFWRISNDYSFFCMQDKEVYFANGGNWTLITTISSTLKNGDIVRIELRGTEHRIYINGTLDKTFTHSSFTTATSYGFSTNSTTTRYDDFTIEDFTGSTGTTITVTLSDTMTISESITKSPSKRLVDSLTPSDTVSKQTSKAISDTVSLSESLYKKSSKNISDTLSLNDTVSKQGNLTKSDRVNLSDTLSKRLTVTVIDNIDLSENTQASQGGKSVALSDTITVTDAIVKKVISTFKSDVINTTDAEQDRITKTLLDNLTLTDTISQSKGKSIILTDSITLTDAISKAVNVIKKDSVTPTDNVSKSAKLSVYDVLLTTDALSTYLPSGPEYDEVVRIVLNLTQKQTIHLAIKKRETIDLDITQLKRSDLNI